jgi:hypothetical protein
MPINKSAPRGLQQQPRRESDPQQQRAGATDFHSRDSHVEGEGSYGAARGYQQSFREYLRSVDGDGARSRSESDSRGER